MEMNSKQGNLKLKSNTVEEFSQSNKQPGFDQFKGNVTLETENTSEARSLISLITASFALALEQFRNFAFTHHC